jgi:hypothetical protein
MDNRKQEEGSLVEPTIRKAPLGNQKTAEYGQKNWNAFRLRILHGGSKELTKLLSGILSVRVGGSGVMGINDILSASRLHKILTKDPMVKFGPLFILSGEYTSSRSEALKLILETYFPGSVEIGERDDAPGLSSLPGRSGNQGLVVHWADSVPWQGQVGNSGH